MDKKHLQTLFDLTLILAVQMAHLIILIAIAYSWVTTKVIPLITTDSLDIGFFHVLGICGTAISYYVIVPRLLPRILLRQDIVNGD